MAREVESCVGIGVEAEGFIVDDQNKGVEFIDGKPASEFVIQAMRRDFERIAGQVSVEQASVMLEIATQVHATERNAIGEVLEVRGVVDSILAPYGARLSFVPVLGQPFRFVPATSDPNSRAHQLIATWGNRPDGAEMLASTAIASFQVNDSRPFAGCETWEQRMETARRIHNAFSASADELMLENAEMRDFAGKTRMERLIKLLTGVKAEQFARHGFDDPMHIVVPPLFASVEAMLRWMRAHSDVSEGKESSPKDAHAVTVKMKWSRWNEGPRIVETRIFDAVEGEAEMLRLLAANDRVLKRAI